MIHRYFVFFLMIICRPHDLIDDISIIRHQQQTSGILVQPSDISHPHRIIQETHNAVAFPPFFCADDAFWLIYRKHDHLILP